MSTPKSLFKFKRGKSLIFFSAPAILLYSVFFMYPAACSILYAFTNWDGLSPHFKFIFLDNFIRMLQVEELKIGIINTLLYSIVNVIFVNTIAIALAGAIHSMKGIRNLFKTAFFIPVMLSSVVIAYVWSSIYRYDGGTINLVLKTFGLDFLTQDWLGDDRFAIFAVAFTIIWSSLGLYLVIFTTGIENIPIELYEAADIDGASVLQKFYRVTFPMLAPVFTICVILSTISGLKVFDQPFLMTRGGPVYATESITTLVIKYAFSYNDISLSCAYSLVLLLIISSISILQARLLRKREVNA